MSVSLPTAMWIVPHTHWDREWYEPHDVFRARLVAMLDGLLTMLEREPAYKFTLDGQSAAIDDYLGIWFISAVRSSDSTVVDGTPPSTSRMAVRTIGSRRPIAASIPPAPTA